jgi:transposase-like protein
MPRQYPPHFRQDLVDRMLAGETVLTLVTEAGVPEQTLHRWKHQGAQKTQQSECRTHKIQERKTNERGNEPSPKNCSRE